jgi:hypothetical protein
METKPKFNTLQEYLDKYLYPSLQIAVDDLIDVIRNTDLYEDLVKEFNQNFFEDKNRIAQKEKELLKLERGSDYSESDYEYFTRVNIDMNESKSENQQEDEQREDFDPDFDDSDMLHYAEQELNKDEEDNKKNFNPIEYLALKLKEINLNKKNHQDLEDVLINYTADKGDVENF